MIYLQELSLASATTALHEAKDGWMGVFTPNFEIRSTAAFDLIRTEKILHNASILRVNLEAKQFRSESLEEIKKLTTEHIDRYSKSCAHFNELDLTYPENFTDGSLKVTMTDALDEYIDNFGTRPTVLIFDISSLPSRVLLGLAREIIKSSHNRSMRILFFYTSPEYYRDDPYPSEVGELAFLDTKMRVSKSVRKEATFLGVPGRQGFDLRSMIDISGHHREFNILFYVDPDNPSHYLYLLRANQTNLYTDGNVNIVTTTSISHFTKLFYDIAKSSSVKKPLYVGNFGPKPIRLATMLAVDEKLAKHIHFVGSPTHYSSSLHAIGIRSTKVFQLHHDS